MSIVNLPSDSTPRRADIQILRALAVLVVLVFHAGIPVSGGYLGVDLFFAISGFVITGLLIREIAPFRLPNLWKFALRRIKRLALPLFTMVFGVLAMAALFMSPAGAQRLVSETALGVSSLRANYVIAENMGGYFDEFAKSNPLLHTWSLAVEEQFYIVFPVFIFFLALVAFWLRRAWIVGAGLVVLTVTSLGYSMILFLGPSVLANSSYFGPVARVWEFAVGAYAAWLARGESSRGSRSVVMAGFSLIAAALIVGSNAFNLIFPAQLLVVFGGALVMFRGFSAGANMGSRSAFGALVKIGDASYSLYLWHWPVIVYFVVLFGDSIATKIAGLFVGLGIGVLADLLVDRRLQKQPLYPLRNWLPKVSFVVLITTAFATAMYSVDMSQEINSKWNGGDLYEFGAANYPQCDLKNYFEIRDTCLQTASNGTNDIVVFGDSHAQQLFLGLAASRTNPGAIIWATSTPTNLNEDFSKFIGYLNDHESVKKVIYTARWLAKLSPEVLPNWREQLNHTIAALGGNGRHVYLVQDVPNFAFQASDCLAKPLLLPATCVGKQLESPVDYMRYFELLSKEFSNVSLISTHEYFCKNRVCSMKPEGTVLYGDSHHLNPVGADYIYRKIKAQIEN